MTILDAFDLYREDYLVLKNRSPKTIESYDVAKKSLVWFTGNADISKLDLDLVLLWLKWLKSEKSLTTGQKRSSNTIRNYVLCLRVLLKYMKSLGYDVIDPKPIPVPDREDTNPEFLSSEAVAELISLAGIPMRGQSEINRRRNQAILSLLYGSGIRASELCAMNRDCFYNDTFQVIGKGRKPRLCFVDDRSKYLIREYLALRTDHNSALFVANQTGRRLTTSNLREIFSTVSKRSGKRVHAHVLRHSFATMMLSNNVNPRHVQVMLGHSSLQTTQMYLHVTNPDLQKIYLQNHTI